MTDEPEDEKKVRKDHIQQLYAVNLFCKHKFEESMKLFVELDTGKLIETFGIPNLYSMALCE